MIQKSSKRRTLFPALPDRARYRSARSTLSRKGRRKESLPSQASSPVFFTGVGYAVFQSSRIPTSLPNEGARNAGATTAPQSCACREFRCTGVVTTRCRFPGVPRAVFEVCSASPRWTSRFRRPLALGRLSTAAGPDGAKRTFDRLPAPPSRGRAMHGWCAGTVRLGPPMRKRASYFQRSARATAPRPTSEDADQTPLANEGRCGL